MKDETNELNTEETKEQTKFKLRPLTKYEQNMMLKAREKHKANIVKEQKCWGKTFKGAAFIPKPEKFNFKDFDVGSTYTQTVTMTNVSFTFNSFKLLSLEPDIKDFFQIQFSPPGKMSAGLTCPITITFTPHIDKDINTILPILSETGRIEVPIICQCKKAIIIFEKNEIDLGDVILGESCKRTMVIKNDGALSSNFKLLDRNGDTLPTLSEQALNMTYDSLSQSEVMATSRTYETLASDSFYAMLKFQRNGNVQGYSSTTLTFQYNPTKIGEFDEEMLVTFDNPMVNQQRLKIKAKCLNVPIYVENGTYDFNVCVIGHIYREKIVLKNRSSQPMKIQLTYPKDTKEHLEFNPTLGFIQGNDQFEIWCKFMPDNSIYTRLASFQETANLFKIPIKVTGSNQILPIEFDIVAELTTESISFQPQILDFKDVFLNTGAKLKFTIKSNSDLPQEFGFVRLPGTISIQPNDGFGTLLPYEELEFTAYYRPAPVKPGTEIGKDSGDIFLRLKTGDICVKEFTFPYVAKLQQCPIKISPSLIELPALPSGETTDIILNITNISRKLPYSFEIIPPSFEMAGLNLTPKVCNKLKNGEIKRVLMRYTASFRDISLETPQENSEINRDSEINKQLVNHGGRVYNFDLDKPDKRSQHYEWTIPVYFKPALPDGQVKKTFIQVRTVVVNKVIRVNQELVDFGDIAVSCRKIVEVKIFNDDSQPVMITMDPLPPFGGFSVLNALRSIESGGSHGIVVEFEPVNQQYFEEKLTLRSQSSAVSVKLIGRGMRPEVALTPEDGLLFMGNSIPGDTHEKTFTLKNISSFAYDFKLIKRAKGSQNYNGQHNFIYIPSYGRIEPGQQTQVKVKFNPDHPSMTYYEHILIEVPNQIDPKELYLQGKCWKRSLFLTYDIPFKWPTATEISKITLDGPLNFLSNIEVNSSLCLTFDKEKSNSSLKIVIGNCKLNDSKLDKPGNFEVVMPVILTQKDAVIFTCDIPKGNVLPGGEQRITFSYNRPAVDPIVSELEVLRGIGQWIENTIELKLQGGWISPGSPDAIIVPVLLRAYVQQI